MIRRSALFLGIVALPAAARADEFSLHALLSTQWAGSDTTFEDGTGGDFTWSYQARPGLLFSYNARRHSHEITVESGVDGTGFESEGISLGFRGALRSVYSLTPRVDGETGATVSGGRTNAFTISTPANTGGPTILPSNQSEYLSVEASEALSYILTPRMTVREHGFGRYLQTTGGMFDTRGYELGGAVGGDRSYQTTAIGVEGRGSWQRLGTDEAMAGTFEYREQIDLRASLRIRRDFSARWSAAIEGGVLRLIPQQDGERTITAPFGSIEVAYAPVWGAATFSIRHNVGPNLFLAQNEISDSVVVNAALPIPSAFFGSTRQQPRLTFQTSTGASYVRFLSNVTGDSVGRFTVFYADAALQYLPKPHLAVGVRFQFVSQSETEDVTDPMLQTLGYSRNTFLVTFAGRWPERLAVEMPVRNRVRVREITPVGDDNTTGITSER